MRRSRCGWAVLLGVMLVLAGSSVHGDDNAVDPALTQEEEVDAEALITRSCTLIAAGDGCIFDLTATANGTLKVDTKAAIAGQRWRATIVEESVAGAVSSVGTGSTTAFTGLAQRSVVSGKRYDVMVTYNSPLPGTFPTSVQVRVNGPVTVTGPRATSGSPETIRSCNQISESAITAAVDVEPITCGTLMTCSISGAGDTDAFRFNAPAGGVVSINIARSPGSAGTPCWRLIGPSGPLTGFVCNNIAVVNLPTTATYTIEVIESFSDQSVPYTFSLQGVSPAFRCSIPIVYGDLIHGKINKEGDTDTFRFNATAGDDVSINIARAPGSAGTPCWRLFSPSGQVLTGFVCNNIASVDLATPGSYTIEVIESFSDQPVEYNLSLQEVN